VLGGTEPVLAAAGTYLRISALGTPFVLFTLVGHGWFRGESDTRTPFAVVLAANVLNVVLEVVLVYGFDTGVAGSAWGTVVAQVVAAVWLGQLTLRRVRAAAGPSGFSSWRPEPSALWALLGVGRHLVVRTLLLVLIFSLATSAASRVGPDALGGHQIGYQVFLFLALSTDALAIAAQAMSGTLLGQGDGAELRSVVDRLVRLSLLVGAGLAVGLAALSPILPHAFSADAGVIRQATLALLFVAALQVPGAIAFTFDGILMGASDFRFLARAMTLALGAFLPFFAAVRVWPRLGLAGVWTGLAVAMCVRAGTNWRRGRASAWMR
jgi:putative MATE family efflux protein